MGRRRSSSSDSSSDDEGLPNVAPLETSSPARPPPDSDAVPARTDRDEGRRRGRDRDSERGREPRDSRDRDSRRHDSGRDRQRGGNDSRRRDADRDRRRDDNDGRQRRRPDDSPPRMRDRDDVRGRDARWRPDSDAERPAEVAEANGPAAAVIADAGDAAAAPADTAAAAVTAAPAAERPAPRLGPAGGAYIPPFKLAQMMRDAEDKEGKEYQRMTWDALRKSLNGLVNKVNVNNIKEILPEFFGENLVRGRGLLARSIMKSQMASPTFTSVYAALVAVINTKFPEFGELLLHRLLKQWMRAYTRNDKPIIIAVSKFIAHLTNQQVVHELLVLEMLLMLLQTPSDSSIEVAVALAKEVGAFLQDVAPGPSNRVYERFRYVMHEGDVDKRVQYTIEALFLVRKGGFEASGFPAVAPELDLVDTEDQITHEVSAKDELEAQVGLDVFKFDPDYTQHEAEYEAIKREILGEESEEEGDEGEEDSSDEEEEEGQDPANTTGAGFGGASGIKDMTDTDLINLRRTIYLTIMSALDFEEAGHKLMKIQVDPGREIEVVTMILECCSQEKTYIRYYGLLAQRFCYIKREYQSVFEDCFRRQYGLIHRLETNKLRNVAKFFAHLLASDAISWGVLSNILLTEDATTSSARIFIKILFQELSESMGLTSLNARLLDKDAPQEWFMGIFPKDTPRNMRFSINFFTSIGLGGLTDDMREHLKQLPAKIMQAQAEAAAAAAASSSSSSSSSSDSDSSSSDSSSSDSSSSDSDSSSSDSDSSSSSDSKSPPPPKKKAASGRGRQRSRQEHSPESVLATPHRDRSGSRRADRIKKEEAEEGVHRGAERRALRSSVSPKRSSRRTENGVHRKQDAEEPERRREEKHGSRRSRSVSPADRGRKSSRSDKQREASLSQPLEKAHKSSSRREHHDRKRSLSVERDGGDKRRRR